MRTLFRPACSHDLKKKTGIRRYVGYIVADYDSRSGVKRKHGCEGLMPGDEISILGHLPSCCPGLVYELDIDKKLGRDDYRLKRVIYIRNGIINLTIMRKVHKRRLKDHFKSFQKSLGKLECPLSDDFIHASALTVSKQAVLKSIFEDSLHFAARKGRFRLYPIVPRDILEKHADETLNQIYEELTMAPHEMLFTKSQIEHFGKAFDCFDANATYDVLTDKVRKSPSSNIIEAAGIDAALCKLLQSTANTCMLRESLPQEALAWGLRKGYFKEAGPLECGVRSFVGLHTAWEHAHTIYQFLRGKKVQVRLDLCMEGAVPNKETLNGLVRRGGQGALLRKYVSKDKILRIGAVHLLGVEAFAKFIYKNKQNYEEVHFHGSLTARVPKRKSDGRLFHDLAKRYGTECEAPRGNVKRYEDLASLPKGQYVVLSLAQQAAVEKAILLERGVYKAGQRVQHHSGRVRVLRRCWREDRFGREHREFGTIKSGVPQKCFFRFAGEREKRPYGDLYDYHHADVALLHSLHAGSKIGIVACESMSTQDELRARELFQTLYLPQKYGTYPAKQKQHTTFLSCVI